MPPHVGPPAAPSADEQIAALEGVVARRRMAREQAQAEAATEATGAGHPQPVDRPWGRTDDALVRRLARVRGWSPAAIAGFLHRPEERVRAALGGQAPGRAGGRP